MSFIFLILHWSAVKKSFPVSLLVGFPLLLIGAALLQPVSARKMRPAALRSSAVLLSASLSLLTAFFLQPH